MTDTMLIEKIDRKCKSKIQELKVYWIFHLVTELLQLQVSKQTLVSLREGKWQDIGHLQYFTAILNGYWGKNHVSIIKDCAAYYLQKIMEDLDKHKSGTDNALLHRYHLCCVAFCMFSRRYFLYFPKQNHPYKKFGFLLWSEFHNDSGYLITPKGFLSFSGLNCAMEIPKDISWLSHDQPIPWIVNFDKCEVNQDFFNLYESQKKICAAKKQGKQNVHPVMTLEMRNYKTPEGCYHYTGSDFKRALTQLRLGVLLIETQGRKALKEKNNFYEIKVFSNTDDRNKGYVQSFYNTGYNCVEMRVIHDKKKLESKGKDLTPEYIKCWEQVSRCRFVYTYYPLDDTEGANCVYEGDLYFTNCHYGWDLIPDSEVNDALTKMDKKKYTKERLNKMKFYDKLDSMNIKDVYRLQVSNSAKSTVLFPFEKIGKLTLNKTGYSLANPY